MSYSTISSLGPTSTPPTLKKLIIFTTVVTLLAAMVQILLDRFNIAPGPIDFLSLSWTGMSNGYIWQPLSYLFIQDTSPNGISIFFLLTLGFNMYLLWILGTAIIEMKGKNQFLALYFTAGILAGLVAFGMMPLTGNYSRLAGNGPSILALLTVWSMAFAEAEMMLFFLIPIKAKWLVTGILAVVFLTTFSHWDLTNLCLYVAAVLAGYFYAALVWGWRSPFAFTKRFDAWLLQLGFRLRRYLPKGKGNQSPNKDKIIDIQTGKSLEKDDAFVDAMLAKISRHGEDSLTWSERRRLKQISEKKSKDSHKP